jgi:hypothetical protein
MVAKNFLVAAIPEGHPLAQKNIVALTEMADAPWFLLSERQGRSA